ncbi:hypothetical protein ACVOMV_24360 [Mesorhizobium atlanticum]
MPSVSTSLVLASPGTPTSSAWPPARERHQRALDDRFLAEDHPADSIADPGDVGQRLFGLLDHRFLADRAFLDHHAHAARSLWLETPARILNVAECRDSASPGACE